VDALQISRVRSFNRTVVERVGALNDHFLGRERPVGEARLLWEIGADGADVRALRARLSLDSGYVSRLLRSLERQRLVAIEAASEDRRVRHVRLTVAGRAERAALERGSNRLARAFLTPLTGAQRETLVDAMQTVERLLTMSLITINVDDPASADAKWCLVQYFGELASRFDTGFDPGASLPADEHEMRAPRGVFLVARLRENPIACGALKLHGRAPAELKRMWVAPAARGLGVGARLLQALEAHARKAGARVVHLETNRTLREAIALYRRSGYREVPAFNDERYAHHWFEKSVD
jgi:DNA-binding MarR family transcriptional regulator/GNAT superfamily N-acetyltransferase